jgi:hypothetical protein
MERSDLEEIRRLSLTELDRFLNLAGNPPGKYLRYGERLIAICLAQGAAQHFIDTRVGQDFDREVAVGPQEVLEKGLRVLSNGQVISGVKDIDVWFFFQQLPGCPIASMRHCRKYISNSVGKLGERSIDFMKKGISADLVEHGDARGTVRAYLRGTEHGRRYLSKKSIVGLYPDAVFAEPFWRVKRIAESGSRTVAPHRIGDSG